MRLWHLFLRFLSSPRQLIALCWRTLFSRKHILEDDEEALIGSAQVVPKRKALLLGIIGPEAQQKEGTASRKGPHNDVEDMRQVLIDIYHYDTNDITVLIDDGDSKTVQPTEDNIIEEMKSLVADARPGDRFYFHYSGHGTQLYDDNGDEEDGLDECILTCDDKEIRDDRLNEFMVKPLPAGCSFISVFDACHSGTFLDLAHHRCNRVYVPWVSKLVPRVVPPGGQHHTDLPAHHHHSPTTMSAEEAAKDVPIVEDSSPLSVHRFCKGRCREDHYFVQDVAPIADVISLSAAKDYQLSWGDAGGTSLTQALIKVLRDDKNPSLNHLLKSVSHDLHKIYIDLHRESREYHKWLRKANIRARRRGEALRQGRKVETENFQDPQISSHLPLSEDQRWEL